MKSFILKNGSVKNIFFLDFLKIFWAAIYEALAKIKKILRLLQMKNVSWEKEKKH